jgi:hypothetical protein
MIYINKTYSNSRRKCDNYKFLRRKRYIMIKKASNKEAVMVSDLHRREELINMFKT